LVRDDANFTECLNHCLAVFNNKIWVIGGRDVGNDYNTDVWPSKDCISWEMVNATTLF
jgi:hypothetical protein